MKRKKETLPSYVAESTAAPEGQLISARRQRLGATKRSSRFSCGLKVRLKNSVCILSRPFRAQEGGGGFGYPRFHRWAEVNGSFRANALSEVPPLGGWGVGRGYKLCALCSLTKITN